MHSVMGSLLAAVWRGRPTHAPLERSLTSMEQEEALMTTSERALLLTESERERLRE